MNSALLPRLDRLSALLEGFAPRVEILRMQEGSPKKRFAACADSMLHLHLVLNGGVSLKVPPHDAFIVVAPAIVLCRADISHELHAQLPSTAIDGLIHARAYLGGPVASLLLAEFAQPLVVPLDASDPSLKLVIDLMVAEVQQPRCGQPALMDRAGDILFIGLLRHLIARPTIAKGLLSGLSDTRIAAALVAMHTAPNGNWNLEALSGAAGMSRTSFALRFRQVMNRTPGKYLAQLKLSIAQRSVQSGQGLKQAARASGYTSVSALSRALSRAKDQTDRLAVSKSDFVVGG